MSYGGSRSDRRDGYDRNRQGNYHQSRSYGNSGSGGDRRDNGGRRGGNHYNGGRNDNYRGGYNRGGGRGDGGYRGSNRDEKIYSFKLFGVDSDVGPCHFMQYFRSNNLKFFYIDCYAPHEFVFASNNSDEVNCLKEHLESLNGSIKFPFINKSVKFTFDGGKSSRHGTSYNTSYSNSSNSTSKRGPGDGDGGNPTKRRRMGGGSEFD